MFGNKQQKASNRIDSLIGLETRIDGNMTFSGGLRVDGEVIGDVTAADDKQQSTLVVSEKARIKGTVRVAHLVLNGTIEGPIYAVHYLELQSKCRVIGDVYYQTLEMHPGAVVSGQLIHLAGKDHPKALSAPANQAALETSAEQPHLIKQDRMPERVNKQAISADNSQLNP